MRVYRGKIEARKGGILLYTFLKISLRKISIFKRTKLELRELLNELNAINVEKKILLNLTNILKAKLQKCRKMKKK